MAYRNPNLGTQEMTIMYLAALLLGSTIGAIIGSLVGDKLGTLWANRRR